MTNHKNTKFLTGALLGAVIGAAAGIFASSKAGKKLGKEVKHKSADFYKFIAPKLKKFSNLTEKEYKEFIKNAAAEFAKSNKSKKLSKSELGALLKDAQAYWKHLKRHF